MVCDYHMYRGMMLYMFFGFMMASDYYRSVPQYNDLFSILSYSIKRLLNLGTER